MRRFHSIIIVFCGVLVLGVFAAMAYQPQDQDAVARRDYMRVKLNFSQSIIEGLSIQDFDQIADAAKEIRDITDGAQWAAIDTPEYAKFSDEMRQSADRLMEMAVNKNLEGSTLRFFDMTLKCIDCHKYIKGRSF